MSEIKFTPSQRAAINADSPKILISAAAGSGKSTVLTERIISSVTSDKKAFDIGRILAVTFTKASAEDLKAKISREVRKAVMRFPDSKRLKNQLIRLSSARISTIHGLCFSLIKSHFQMLGLSASMRVADEVEAAALRNEVLTELIESAYAGYFEPIPDFAHFTENFIGERDDSLNKILFDVYDKIKNIPDGFTEWERKTAAITENGDFGKSGYASLILFHLSLFTDYALLLTEKTVERLSSDETYAEKYLPAFYADRDFLLTLKALIKDGDYGKISAHLCSYTPVKLKSVSAALKTDDGEYAKDVTRVYIKDGIKKFNVGFFSVSDDEIRRSGEQTASISRSLILFLKEFDRRFTEEKLRRSVLDFNDLEHFTLKLLYNTDGSVSETAKKISESLDEIYVDEYQDVNPLQNKIFEALSVSCPIFMVGDIKQSIYSFRGAAPSIFSDYRRRFAEHKEGTDRYERDVTVFLSDNFRSASNVTEFVNAVSDPLFNTPHNDVRYSYRIPYSKDDRLVCNVSGESPEVCIMIAEEKKDPHPLATGEEDPAVNEIGAEKSDGERLYQSACHLEAEMVANKISEIISEGAEPSEIAILLRSTKTDAPIFEAALKKRNIPISTDKGASLFDAPEVQLSLCLLNVVDNPYRDIFLAGALRSPVFGFTLDDLIRVRQYNTNAPSLFDALRGYTSATGFDKGVYFLEFLTKMRAFSSENSVHRTLWHIYTETAFFTLIYDGGASLGTVPAGRRANLLKLHALAKSFSETGKNSLYSFIEYLRFMMSGEKPPSSASISGDGVKIMSIHHSKGLEFTHCFLSRTSRSFSIESHKAAVTVDSEHGIAMRIKDSLRLTSADTVYRRALIMHGDLYQSEEEMRLLYVALSRARTALYISGTVRDFETLERSCHYSASSPHPMLFSSQKSYLEWIITALKCKTDLSPRCKISVLSPFDIYGQAETMILTEASLKRESAAYDDCENAYSVLKERFDFRYPYEKTSFIPSKLSVSRLYPEILDALETETLFSQYGDEFYIPDLDEFTADPDKYQRNRISVSENGDVEVIDGDLTSESDGITPPDNSPKMKTPAFLLDADEASGAERGTATHVFMQFCDFENVTVNGIESEITRLTEKRFILPAHAELIDRRSVKSFFDSSLFEKMKNAVSLKREYRFNIKLPASDFTKSPDLKEQLKEDFVFVQGVIDCYFRDGDGKIYLVDYKTDRVPKDVRGNEEKERAFFTERYSSQLGYYKKALEKLTGSEVYKTFIYSFSLGKTITVD